MATLGNTTDTLFFGIELLGLEEADATDPRVATVAELTIRFVDAVASVRELFRAGTTLTAGELEELMKVLAELVAGDRESVRFVSQEPDLELRFSGDKEGASVEVVVDLGAVSEGLRDQDTAPNELAVRFATDAQRISSFIEFLRRELKEVSGRDLVGGARPR